jgi:DNA-directed RNA polymerase specialized sigma24 family protein
MTGISQSELSLRTARKVILGDSEAIADAYGYLAQPIMNLAARILKDRQLAEEVLQDIFIDLVEKATQIGEAAAIVGWVRRVATDQTLAHVDPSMSGVRSASQIEPRLVAPRLAALRDRSQDLERQAYDVDSWRQSNSAAELQSCRSAR